MGCLTGSQILYSAGGKIMSKSKETNALIPCSFICVLLIEIVLLDLI